LSLERILCVGILMWLYFQATPFCLFYFWTAMELELRVFYLLGRSSAGLSHTFSLFCSG
jgi:hypothetical protein